MASARILLMSSVIIAALVRETHSVVLAATGGTVIPLSGALTAAGVGAGNAAAGTTAAGTAAATGTAAAAAGTVAGTAAAGAASGGAGTIATNGMFAITGLAAPLSFWGQQAAMLSTMGVSVGLLTVGAEADGVAVTWDCWKPILREKKTAPSRGRLLADILNDPVVDDYRIEADTVFLRNRWNESWRIDPLILPWGQVAAHASKVDSANRTISGN
eukprot:TRINITY_DN6449_c0_g1_i1.p1 TRINITY_DN6449_c0_g1~~TRINITY_DN6449_c0_g1_i1.p1  ORF type:complete len:216 (-),score=24.26 TRINITY_DN6449_c0_g1_i1:240-887(-)